MKMCHLLEIDHLHSINKVNKQEIVVLVFFRWGGGYKVGCKCALRGKGLNKNYQNYLSTATKYPE